MISSAYNTVQENPEFQELREALLTVLDHLSDTTMTWKCDREAIGDYEDALEDVCEGIIYVVRQTQERHNLYSD